jgi:hypothetical protein
MYAGIVLYDGRQVVATENHDAVSRQRRDFDRYLRQIHKGQLKLFDPVTDEPLAITSESTPFAVADTVPAFAVDTVIVMITRPKPYMLLIPTPRALPGRISLHGWVISIQA